MGHLRLHRLLPIYTRYTLFGASAKVYNFIFNNPKLPSDLIPYWDYDAPNIPNEPRDASAAAVTASALYELSTYLSDKNIKKQPIKLLKTLVHQHIEQK